MVQWEQGRSYLAMKARKYHPVTIFSYAKLANFKENLYFLKKASNKHIEWGRRYIVKEMLEGKEWNFPKMRLYKFSPPALFTSVCVYDLSLLRPELVGSTRKDKMAILYIWSATDSGSFTCRSTQPVLFTRWTDKKYLKNYLQRFKFHMILKGYGHNLISLIFLFYFNALVMHF